MRRDARVKIAEKQKAKAEVEGCTFKPKLLTKNSKWGRNEEKRNAANKSVVLDESIDQKVSRQRHDELFDRVKSKQQKLDKMKKDQDNKLKQTLKFKPQINDKSRQMVKARLTQCTMQSAAQIKKATDLISVNDSDGITSGEEFLMSGTLNDHLNAHTSH